MQHVEIPLVAPSLGGVETLATRPVLTTHVGLSPAEREAIGIRDGLIRVSVGIEGADDLVQDFLSALDAAEAGSAAETNSCK
jgi:cystathionine gamma-synthase/cystathionine gamma-lyase/cystathionine beta-lyase